MSLAYQDPVTLGDNFAAFKKKAKSKKDGVGMADCYGCDRFKLISSTCGVKKGDEVLRVIWEIFETETGENELAAHVNADRFILFWMDENQENIKQRHGTCNKKDRRDTGTSGNTKSFPGVLEFFIRSY